MSDRVVEAFLALLPHYDVSLSIEHNEHKASHMKPSEYLNALGWTFEDHGLTAEELAECDTMDSYWRIQWYPDTTVGFYAVYGPTLEAAVRKCLPRLTVKDIEIDGDEVVVHAEYTPHYELVRLDITLDKDKEEP